jgi:hypothetical protein
MKEKDLETKQSTKNYMKNLSSGNKENNNGN